MSKSKGKPGEWWLIISLSCLLIGPILGLFTMGLRNENQAMQEQAVVAKAEVVRKFTEELTHSNRKGRQTNTTSYKLEVAYDAMSQNSFKGWVGGEPYKESQFPVRSTWSFETTQDWYEKVKEKDAVMIAMLPSELQSMDLAEEILETGKGPMYPLMFLGSAVLVIAGIGAGLLGWRQRKAPVPVPA